MWRWRHVSQVPVGGACWCGHPGSGAARELAGQGWAQGARSAGPVLPSSTRRWGGSLGGRPGQGGPASGQQTPHWSPHCAGAMGADSLFPPPPPPSCPPAVLQCPYPAPCALSPAPTLSSLLPVRLLRAAPPRASVAPWPESQLRRLPRALSQLPAFSEGQPEARALHLGRLCLSHLLRSPSHTS